MSQTPHPTSDLKQDYNKNGGGGSGKIKFFDIEPPIEAICEDEELIKQSFKGLPIIPYAGTNDNSSHKLVKVLYNFKDMSTTFSGLLTDLKSYTLKGKLQIQKNENQIFDIGDEVKVSEAEQRNYAAQIDENFHFGYFTLPELSYLLFDCYRSVGMVGVEIIKKTILGKTTICYKYHNPYNYVFLLDRNIGSEICISLKWDEEYLKKNPPLLVPLYPNWGTKYKDGYERTFYYQKEGAGLYGRPTDLAALPDKYNEYKLKQYLTKKNKKLWTPDVFIESEDSNNEGAFTSDENAKAAGFKNAQDRIERKFTNSGDDALTFIFTNRPFGSSPTFIHEFAGLKNSKEVMLYRDMFKEGILAANSWPKLLADMEGATGFSNNAFMEVFSIKSVTTLEEIQTLMAGMMNALLGIGFEALNIKTDLGIRYKSALTDLLNEFNLSRGSNTTKPITTNIDGATATDM